jgi:hypothetical protein
MRLNRVPVEPGTGPSAVTGGLASSKKARATAGEGVDSLRRSVSTTLTTPENGQAGRRRDHGLPDRGGAEGRVRLMVGSPGGGVDHAKA